MFAVTDEFHNGNEIMFTYMLVFLTCVRDIQKSFLCEGRIISLLSVGPKACWMLLLLLSLVLG